MTLNYASFINFENKSSFNRINEMIDIDTDINYVGKRVKIADNSMYLRQAYENNGDGEGVIIDFTYDTYIDPDDDYEPHYFHVRWNNNHENSYRAEDLILIDDEKNEEYKKIRWYKKGKFTTEATDNNIPVKGDLIKDIGVIYFYAEYKFIPKFNENKWEVAKPFDKYKKILDVKYINNSSYKGYVVYVEDKWPWYKFENFDIIKQ